MLALSLVSPAAAGSGPGGSTVTHLAGNKLIDGLAQARYPYVEYVRAFRDNAPVHYGIDPTRFPSVQGATCNVFVVEALTALGWAALVADPQHDLHQLEVRAAYQPPSQAQATCFPQQPTQNIQDYTCLLAAAGELDSAAEPCHEGVCYGLGRPYDVVLDCDQDGQLGAADLLDDGSDEAGLYIVHDAKDSGGLALSCLDYLLEAPDVDGFANERLYVPADWCEIAGCPTDGQGNCPTGPCADPLPLVLISHGSGHSSQGYDYLQRHLASYGYIVLSHANDIGEGLTPNQADGPHQTTLEHTDEFLDVLASPDCASRITLATSCGESSVSDLSVSELCALGNVVDTDRIVWIGHSLGGNGVVLAYDRLAGLATPMFSSPHFDRDSISLLSTMAPIDRPINATPDTKPFHLMWSAGDLDVRGAPGVESGSLLAFQMLDRARGHKQSAYVHGGSHGWFHEDCDGTTINPTAPLDCPFVDQDGGAPVGFEGAFHDIVRRSYVPLLAAYLDGNLPAQDFFWRPWEQLHGGSAGSVALEHHVGVDPDRFVLDDYELNENTNLSSSGLHVGFIGLQEVTEALLDDDDCHFDWLRSTEVDDEDLPACGTGAFSCEFAVGPGWGEPNFSESNLVPCDFSPEDPDCDPFVGGQDPMNGMTRSRDNSQSRGVVLEWGPPGSPPFEYAWSVPPQAAAEREDLFLSFRAAQMPRHPRTRAEMDDLDFAVTLEDASFNTQTIQLSAYGAGIIEPYQRRGPGVEGLEGGAVMALECGCSRAGVCCHPSGCNPNLSDPGWQAEFETVRIRLTDFLTNGSGVDLDDLKAVRFEFGSGATEGRIAIDDVEIVTEGILMPPPEPCPFVQPCNGYTCFPGTVTKSEDTGLLACQPTSGPGFQCDGTETVHMETRQCDQAACCSESPPCVCQMGCSTGTYLVCN